MEQGRRVSRTLARAAAVADRRVTGLSREVLAELVVELGPRWQARQDARLADRPRRRAVGAGARYRLVFVDRLLASPVQLRHGVVPRQAAGRSSVSGKLGISGSARPRWISRGGFQASASCGRTVLYSIGSPRRARPGPERRGSF